MDYGNLFWSFWILFGTIKLKLKIDVLFKVIQP